jgi:hypothetical protein
MLVVTAAQRAEAGLSPGVQGQPVQQRKTPSPKKNEKRKVYNS